MKQLSRAAKLTPEVLYAILTEEKPNQKEQVRIKTESLRKYFPRNYSAQQMEWEIIKLLETIIAFGRPNALVRGKHSPKTLSIERKNRYEKPTDQNIAPFE